MAFDDLMYDDPSLQDDWFAQNAPADAWAGPNPISPGPTPPPGTTIDPNPEGGTSSPSPSATAPASGGLSFPGGDPLAWAQAQFASLPPTSDSLIKIYEALKKAGVPVERPTHANGTLLSDDKLTINGRMYDFIRNVGGADAAWAFGEVGGDGGGLPGNFGGLLEPFGQEPPPALDLPQYTPPDPFSYEAFKAPTGEEVLAADPGYGFRVKQGEQALLQNKAARGLGFTGGTFKALLDYNQSAGSQEYAQAFDRSLNTYGTNRNNAADAYGRNFGVSTTAYGLDTDRLKSMQQSAYDRYLAQYTAFRNRQRDTNEYLTEQQRIGASTL